MSDRRRNVFVLLAVGLLLLGSLMVVVGIPGVVKARKTKLGLDLQGGVELVYQAKPTKQSQVTADSLNRAIDIMQTRVNQLGVSEPDISRLGANQIVVDLPAVKNAQRAAQEVGQVAQLFFYDWETNVIGPNGKPAPGSAAVTGGPQAGEPATGLSLYDAVILGSKRPPFNRPNDTTNGTWYLVNDKTHSVVGGPEDSRANLSAERNPPPGSRVVEVPPGTLIVQAQAAANPPRGVPLRYYVLNDNPVLKGTDVKNPQQSFDNGAGGTGQPIVTFDFSGHGKSVFQNVTRQIAQRGQALQLPGVQPAQVFQHFAIVLDNKLISVPYIDFRQNPDGIDASNGSQIQGGFTIDSAQRLADLLKSGALPIKLALISQSQVSATLGKQALNQGLIAGLAGLAIVALFLLAFYRVLGLIAVGALLIYTIYFFAIIKVIPIVLTLPGIAGLILTIGVAADANIVIFERVKEEIRAGRSIAAGIASGYKRGLAAIVDANVVTLMVAFILFVLATAGVKGFALTLGIGVILSFLTAVVATQAALGSMGRSRAISNPTAVGAGPQRRRWSYDFMGASRWFFSLSGTILLIGALAIGGKGLNLGIDFESGTRIQTGFSHSVSENQIRSVLKVDGYSDAHIQRVIGNKALGPNAFQISTKTLQPARVATVKTQLDQRFGTRNFSSESIGPTFGSTIAKSAVIAIIASLLVISLYIALRFEWKYAVPVLIALMHDLLITAGVYSLLGREVTRYTVAALLTILGYSLYDTIIVFDRVRENVPRMPRAAFSQIVNRSMSEVLTRSLATSFCTLLPVLALLLFGGQTLKDFAFALLVGVASGAYSSIFIASPVLTHWKEREPLYRARRVRLEREFGAVPAYAAPVGGAPTDVAPTESRRRRRTSLTAPDEAGEQISRKEFDELVRDLDVEEPKPERAGARRASPPQAPTPGTSPEEVAKAAGLGDGPPPEPAPEEANPAADLRPEDVVMPKRAGIDGAGLGRAKGPRSKRGSGTSSKRRHGRKR
jgi:SecD/SecF fusion protein